MLSDSTKQELLSNQILINNLSAYLSRYPEDQRRLFDIVLRKIENPPKIEGFKMPSEPASYRCRLCFIASIMSPEFWAETHKLWKADAYFIIESNPDAVAHAFQTIGFSGMIRNPAFHFYLGYEEEEVIAPLQRTLRQTQLAGKLYLSYVIAPNRDEGIEEKYAAYADNFNQLLRKTIEHVYFNFGNLNDSVEGVRATFANLDRIKHSGGVTELEGIHKGKPIVVVGAGPSLDLDLDLLVQNQNKFVIVAVDAAVLPLHKAGCRIDYVTTIERDLDATQIAFFKDLPEMEAELIAFPVVHPEVLKAWPGSVRFTYRNYAWYAYFEKHWPMGILESGGSASHLAVKLALHLGAEKIYLLGCDMTYEKKEGEEKWRSHCSSTAFPQWNHYRAEDEIRSAKDFYGFYDVQANDGSLVKTHTIYHQWAKEYGNLILANSLEGRLLSTSLKGVKVPRMPYVPFGDVCKNLPDLASVSMKHPPNLRPMNITLDHLPLASNLRGILQTFEAACNLLDFLIEHPEMESRGGYEQAYQCFYGKFCGDTFFTAFIVQNCAMEFFTAESKLYGIADAGKDKDEFFTERCQALKMLYQVIVQIAAKTLNVIERDQKNVQ